MTPKEFSQSLYDDNDDAKYQIIAWLEERGFMAWVNEDQYGIDVQALKMGKQYVFEVEVKHNWNQDGFPFDTVHFPLRKQKFAGEEGAWFVMLNADRTQALFVSGAVFMQSPTVRKRTRYTDDEEFVEIPISRCIFRQLTGGANR
jgi:hypothetical protein